MNPTNDNEVMRVLGLTEIRHILAHTSKGELCLQLNKGESKYRFVLDAVPVDDEMNKNLKKLFKIEH